MLRDTETEETEEYKTAGCHKKRMKTVFRMSRQPRAGTSKRTRKREEPQVWVWKSKSWPSPLLAGAQQVAGLLDQPLRRYCLCPSLGTCRLEGEQRQTRGQRLVVNIYGQFQTISPYCLRIHQQEQYDCFVHQGSGVGGDDTRRSTSGSTSSKNLEI